MTAASECAQTTGLPEARSCLLAALQPLTHRLANSLAHGLRKHRVNVSGNRPE